MSPKPPSAPGPELFRDRTNPWEQPKGIDLADDLGDAVDPNSVDSTLVREVLLGAIGNLQAKVQSGRFGQLDAATLEKLLTLTKDWPVLAKAVDDLQNWTAHQEARQLAAAGVAPTTRSTLRALRAVHAVITAPDPAKK